jgi:hypothetical protein
LFSIHPVEFWFGFVPLCRLLLNLFLALNHDHGQEEQDDRQTKDQEDAWDTDRVFSGWEVGVEKVGLIDEGLSDKQKTVRRRLLPIALQVGHICSSSFVSIAPVITMTMAHSV